MRFMDNFKSNLKAKLVKELEKQESVDPDVISKLKNKNSNADAENADKQKDGEPKNRGYKTL